MFPGALKLSLGSGLRNKRTNLKDVFKKGASQIHMQAFLWPSISYSTFLTVLPPVSVFAFTGVASISLVAIAPIQTGRGVADRSGLY